MTTDTKLRHTQGEWRLVAENDGFAVFCEGQKICDIHHWMGAIEDEANAQLIAEAGIVASETGLSPRQLAEQRKELLEALEDAAEALELTAEWVEQETKAKGTAQGISNDAKKTRAAIARAKGEAVLAV